MPLDSVDDSPFDAYGYPFSAPSASSASSPPSLFSNLEASISGGSATPPASMARSSGPPTMASSSRAGSIQPQFNMDSATQLLAYFRTHLLGRFPVLELPEDATVAGLARERPFVLLAILAATSAARAVGGRSLYDQEFRKVLGVKFVAGQERTVEMLVGLLVYCAW